MTGAPDVARAARVPTQGTVDGGPGASYLEYNGAVQHRGVSALLAAGKG